MADAKTTLNKLNGTKAPETPAGLTDVPQIENKALYKFLVSMRSWVNRWTNDSPSWDRLRRAGVVRHDEITGDFVAIGGRPSYVVPPAPTGLVASGAMTSILVSWTAPPYSNHAYTEVWAHTADVLASAKLIAREYSTTYPHSVGASQTRYYWIRFVTTANVIGPFNATAGVVGVTSADPAALLSILTGSLSTSQLVGALNTRINLIDAGFGTAGSVDARIKTETDARVSADGSLSTQISALAVSSDGGFDNVKIYYFDTAVDGWTGNGVPTVAAGFLKPAVHATDPYVISPSGLAVAAVTYLHVKARIKKTGTPAWEGRIYYQRTIDSTWDIARSVAISEPTYTGGIAAPTWDFTGLWDGTINQIRIDLSSVSDATNYFEIDWAAIGRSAPGASTAQIVNIETAQIGYCSVSGVPNDYTTRTTCEANGGVWNTGIPLATAVKQVAVSDGTGLVAIEQRFIAQKTKNNTLDAQYTVKVDANGYVSGFGLATSTVNSAPFSEFAIVADQFSIAPVNTDNAASDGSPFFYRTASTTINGVIIPAGAYMKSAYIHDASITNAKIANLAVDDAKISALTASKLTAGTVTATFLNIGDTSFAFDAPNRIMRITDTQASPKVRFTAGKIGAGAQDYGFAAYNADGSVLMSTGRAFDSTIINAQAAQGAIGLLSESWENPDVLTYWEVKQGAGELSIVTVSDSVAGGKILRIGNNVGNDESWMVYKFNLPFDSTKLYKVKIRVRRTLGAGTLYVGFLGIGSDGSTIVSATGTASYLTPCWHVAAAQSPLSSWTEYEGYTRGFGAPNGTTTAGSISSPGTMHSSTRYMRPVILPGYSAAAGTFEIDSYVVEEVPNTVDWANNISGTGKPENNATVGAPVGTYVGGTLAQTVEGNAGTALTGTVNYRTAGAPTNNPAPSFGQVAVNTNGSADIQVGWSIYTQGASKADVLILFWRSGSVSQPAPTLISPSVMFNVNTTGAASYALNGVNPAHFYSFGIAAARRTEAGLEIGPIISPSTSPDWHDLGGNTANFTANINGVSAATVQANADSGGAANSGTLNYRVNAEPANNPVFGTITKSVTSDGNSVVYVPYTYTQGSPVADQIFIFVREGGGIVVAADPAMATNAVSGEVKFTLKPLTTYTFGLQAARRTESGFVGKAILTSASIVTDAANFTGNLNSVAAATVVSDAANGSSAWGKFSGAGSTLPSGNVEFNYALGATKGGDATNANALGGTAAGTINGAVVNFNNRNDRTATAVVAPGMAYTAALIDHTVNTDGSADVSAEWTWGGVEADIDGFIVYLHDNGTTTPVAVHTFTGNAEAPGTVTETVFYVDAKRRAFILKGVAVNHWYTFGVQAYRIVDKDINADSVMRSTIAQTSSTGTVGEWTWGAYRPESNVAFGGDVTYTINGAPVATVVSGAAEGAAVKVFRVVATGFSSTTQAIGSGIYESSGAALAGSVVGRSYNVDVFNRTTMALVSSTTYDVYLGGTAPGAMATALNALGSDRIVVIRTLDEPATNRTLSGLPSAIYRCGGTKTIFESNNFKNRSAYVLIGIPGMLEGNGLEYYSGDTDSSTTAWVDAMCLIKNGIIQGAGISPQPYKAIEDGLVVGDKGYLRNVGWAGGDKRININFEKSKIGIGSDTWTGTTPTVPCVILDKNVDGSGLPRTYAGDGAHRFSMFDGTDMKIGRDTKILGADAYNNTSVYRKFLGNAVGSFYYTATGSGGMASYGHVVSATGGSSAGTYCDGIIPASLALDQLNLSKTLRFKFGLLAQNMNSSNVSGALGLGLLYSYGQNYLQATTTGFLGVAVISGNLYALLQKVGAYFNQPLVYGISSYYSTSVEIIKDTSSIEFKVNGASVYTHPNSFSFTSANYHLMSLRADTFASVTAPSIGFDVALLSQDE